MVKEDDKKKIKPAKVVTDERFAAVQYDPRFQRFPKAHAKIEVDDRFKGMFNDPTFRVGAALDKRGKKSKSKGKQHEDVKRYYRLKDDNKQDDDEDHEESDEIKEDDEAQARWARMRGLAGPDSSEDEDDSQEEEIEEDSSDNEQDDDGEEEEDDDDDDDDELERAKREWGIGAMAANPEESIPLLPDATPRLACVDLDWEHVSAADIYVALRSFVPSGGKIHKVSVYVSDYGKERMEAEAKAGPQGIWKESKRTQHSKQSIDDDDDDDALDDDALDDGEIDTFKLRLYERSKLRWYYAIVECDSAATANQIYEECDGMELMKTACKFDLRFVPEEQSFEGRSVRDAATDVPEEYAPPQFHTKALQHTSVELTWDKGDDIRKRALSKKLTADEIKEDDFKAYLASDSNESSEEEGDGDEREDAESIRERYRNLLLLGGGSGGGDDGGGNGREKKKMNLQRAGNKDWNGGDEEEEEKEKDNDKKMEMEVTFLSGLENLGAKLLEKKQKKAAAEGETVWEAYVRRKKEKKAEARRLGKTNIDSEEEDDDAEDAEYDKNTDYSDEEMAAGVDDDPFFQHDENPFDDPFFKDSGEKKDLKNEKKKDGKISRTKNGRKTIHDRNNDDGDERKQRAELEMLLMDNASLLGSKKATKNADATDNTKTKISKKERARLKKEQRRRERHAGSDDEDHEDAAGIDFAVNMQDPRFQDLFKSSDFALDPTDPRFKKAGPGAAKLATEAAKRRSKFLEQSEKNHQDDVGVRSGEKSKKGNESKVVMDGSGSDAADLKLMVASLKRKANDDLRRRSKKSFLLHS